MVGNKGCPRTMGRPLEQMNENSSGKIEQAGSMQYIETFLLREVFDKWTYRSCQQVSISVHRSESRDTRYAEGPATVCVRSSNLHPFSSSRVCTTRTLWPPVWSARAAGSGTSTGKPPRCCSLFGSRSAQSL
eukprot:3357705-Pyramimonas_sp.AAC.1